MYVFVGLALWMMYVDKVEHAIVFAILALCFALRQPQMNLRRRLREAIDARTEQRLREQQADVGYRSSVPPN